MMTYLLLSGIILNGLLSRIWKLICHLIFFFVRKANSMLIADIVPMTGQESERFEGPGTNSRIDDWSDKMMDCRIN